MEHSYMALLQVYPTPKKVKQLARLQTIHLHCHRINGEVTAVEILANGASFYLRISGWIGIELCASGRDINE